MAGYVHLTSPNPRNYGNNIEISKAYPFDEWADFDVLTTEYPALKNKIQQARNNGVPDNMIDNFIKQNIEPRLNFVANKDKVNAFLGRTPESQKQVADYYQARKFNMLKMAYPDKSDDDIFNAIGISQWSGVSAKNLIENPDLFKKLTEGQKVRESVFESGQRGFSNYMTQRDIASVGQKYLLGQISKEQAYKQEQELSQKFVQEPLVTTGMNDFVAGGAKVLTQGYNTTFTAGLAGLATGGTLGLFGAPVGLGHAGFSTGYKIGSLVATANELFALQAGADMLEFSKMTDINGKPIDENAARVAAIITGGITVATEMLTLPGIAKLFPGADKLFGLDKTMITQALKHPVVQEQLAKIAVDTAKGIGWGTVNNVVETLGHDLGIPIAEFISGQDFPQKDLGVIEHVIDATVSSIRDFSASAIPGLILNIANLGHKTAKYKKALAEISKQTGFTEAQIETELDAALNEISNPEQEIIEQPITAPEVNSIQENTPEQNITEEINTPEIREQVQEIQQAPEMENVQTEENITQPETEPEQKVSYIFVPKQAFDELRANHEELQNVGLDVDSETGLTPEQFELIKEIEPDFAVNVANDTRYGTDGTTINEGIKKVEATDEARAEFYHSPENQQTINKVTQDFINAGENEEYAQDLGRLTGAINASFLAREGVPLTGFDVANAEENTNNLTESEVETKNLLDTFTGKNKEQGEQYNKLDENGNPIAFTEWKAGRALISLVKSGNFAANIHEIGHVTFDLMHRLAKQGSLQMQEDFETILRHADVTLEAWEADVKKDKGGAREKAHEYFSNALEVYMYEGKAPSEGLQKTFDRVRNFLLKLYDDITNQLGIEIDDEVRQVFDRLFTLPGDEDSTIGTIVLEEIQLENQIDAYRKMERQLEEQRNASEKIRREFEEQGGLEISEEGMKKAEDIQGDLDYYDILMEEYNLKRENVENIINSIKNYGGIQLADLRRYVDKDTARLIYNRFRGLFTRKGRLALNEMTEHLVNGGYSEFLAQGQYAGEGHGDANALVNWLSEAAGTDPDADKPRMNSTFYKVDTDLINALMANAGLDGAVEYLQRRRKELINAPNATEERTKEIKDIEGWLEYFKNMDDDLDEDLKAPKKKNKITRADLVKAASTGFKMGQGQEKEIAKLRQSISKLEAQERVTSLKEAFKAKREKMKETFQTRIDRLKERIQNLRNYKNAASEKRNINRLVKSIVKMSKAKNILYDRLADINKILELYNLSLNEKAKHQDIKALLETFDVEHMTVEDINDMGITQQDIRDFLHDIHVEDMTLAGLRALHKRVKKLYDQGRREFAIWNNERQQRRAGIRAELQKPLERFAAPDKTIITGNEDINKKFRLGSVGELWNSFRDAVETPGRFLEGLGESFRYYFEDRFTELRGQAVNFISQRELAMISKLKELGLTMWDFAKPAFELDGKVFSWEEVHSIYLAMKNNHSAQAVLWGNFVQNLANQDKLYFSEEEGMNAINKVLEFINNNPKQKQAADLIIQEMDENFDRINRAGIEQFNRGMNKEENYTPIHRLRHQSSQGLIDAELEKIGQSGQAPALMQKVENGFMTSRENISPAMQQPIDLHVWSNWLAAITQQEYMASLGGYASDLVSALLQRGDNGLSVQEMIKSRLGKPDWDTLRSIFNDSITDREFAEQETTRKLANFLTRSRSYAYVPFRFTTAIIQSTSYFTALGYTNHLHWFRSLAKFAGMGLAGRGNEFLEHVYEKAPELRFTGGDFVDNQFRRELKINRGGSSEAVLAAKRLLDKGYEGVRVIDNWTKSLVFHAVYESELSNGKSEQEAIRLANRAVRDTQPASSNRESTRLNRAGGWTRFLFTQFMAPLAPIFNMATVDIARNLTSKSWNGIKKAAWLTLSAGLSIASTQLLRDLFNGRLPDGSEDENGNINDWGKWSWDTMIDGLIGSAPLFNRTFSMVRRIINGSYHSRNENRMDAPFEAFAKAVDYGFNTAYEGTKKRKAVNELIKGLALVGVPVPYAGVKDFLRWLGFDLEEEEE